MRLGLDFGTTNSSAAVFDGDALRPIAVDPSNDNPYILPSLLYIDRRGDVVVGAGAAEAYLRDETGRPVSWRRREVGDIATTVASWENDPIEFFQRVTAFVDEAANGRLLQSLKAALFSGRYNGTQIFDRYYKLEALIALILRPLKTAAEQMLGQTCESLLLGRPVRFSHNPLIDSRAESILLKAAHLAGFRDIVFQYEPVGVAHLVHRTSRERQTVLVFDFGGGTLDLTVAEVGGTHPPRILATTGVVVGGDDLDRRVMSLLLPHFGVGENGVLPAEVGDKLLAWQTMPELSRPGQLERIRRLAKQHPAHRLQLEALQTLVSRNLGFALFKEIERAKKQLSEQDTVTLRFEYEAIQITETITRRRFDRLIADEMRLVTEGIESVLAQAGRSADEIDVVLRTGGSSLVPACGQLLADFFGADRLHAIDPLVSVVGGFAVAAHTTIKEEVESALVTDVRSVSGRECAVSHVQIGAVPYTDWNFTVSRIPSKLDGLPMIQTPNHDRESADGLCFTLLRPARVYVAYDADAAQLPGWLQQFTPEPMQVEIEDEFANIARTLRVYGRDYPAGEIALGGAQAAHALPPSVHYVVIIRPTSGP